MKIILIFLLFFISIFLSSCTRKIIPGEYIYKDTGNHIVSRYTITIDKENNYKFKKFGEGYSMFSQGKVENKNGVVSFIPDSLYFFNIKVLNHYFDSTLPLNQRKIVLNNKDDSLKGFSFSFNNGINDIIYFDSGNSVIYKPIFTSFQDGSIYLKVKMKDSITIVPVPLHDSLFSNRIEFFDVNNDDPDNKKWNVLEFKVFINRGMFEFTTLPDFILRGKRLVQKSPIYELMKQ